MTLLLDLRDFLYRRALRKFKDTNLSKAPDNHFGQIRKVGIIFDANEAKDREAVMAYADRLRKTGINVWIFGYFNTKIEDITFPFDFIDTTSLSFAHLPKGEKIRDFIGTKFDVLINLDTAQYPAVGYIAAASQALFKIGPANGNPAHYDLMVESSSQDLRKYIDDIRTIVNKISG